MLNNFFNHLSERKTKNHKTIRNNYLPTKTFDTVDINPIIAEYPKTWHKSSNTTRKDDKEGRNSSLCGDKEKSEKRLKEKHIEIKHKNVLLKTT